MASEEAMEREVAAAPSQRELRLPVARDEKLSIRSGELIAVMAAVLGLTIILWNRERLTDWYGAAAVLVTIAIAPLALRAVQSRFAGNRWIRFLADFGPIGYIVGLYLYLNPILDAVNIPIADEWLVQADQRIFGLQPAIWLQQVLPPVVNDVLLGAYTTYFIWPLALGLVLWLQRRETEFDEFVTALMFFYAVNYAFYAIVPAMGPRYYQAAFFDGPVQGQFFAQHIETIFRASPLARDCFPSGHTGISLLVLGYAWRTSRRFFWFALPFMVCLILGTLAGRFHYGIDLIAALPLTALSLFVAATLRQRMPEGMLVGRALPSIAVRRDRPSS